MGPSHSVIIAASQNNSIMLGTVPKISAQTGKP